MVGITFPLTFFTKNYMAIQQKTNGKNWNRGDLKDNWSTAGYYKNLWSDKNTNFCLVLFNCRTKTSSVEFSSLQTAMV